MTGQRAYAWQEDALCRQIGDPERWFPSKPDPYPGKVAKRICASCPVRVECLDFALAHDETGVWGGTTDAERRRMKMRRVA